MVRIPAENEGKIISIHRSRDSIFFYPHTISIFRITPVIKDILTLRNNTDNKARIVNILSKKYDSKTVKKALCELERLSRKGIFDKLGKKAFADTKKIINSKISSIDIYLSHRCNMACSYCFNKGGGFGRSFKREMMDWRTAKKALD